MAADGEQGEQAIFAKLEEIRKGISKYEGKLPFLIGFLGRALSRQQKVKLLRSFPEFFEFLLRNVRENNNYKTTLMMLSAFIKDWHSDDEDHNQAFEQIIAPLITAILANFRSL